MYGVARSSVREALSALEALGILKRRVGDGTYVQSCDIWLLSRAMAMSNEGAGLRSVFELQQILEVGVAELAAQVITQDKLEEAEAAVKKMRCEADSGDIESYLAADRRFHLTLAKATDNPLLEQAVCQLMEQMNKPLWRAVKRYFIRSQTEYLEQSLKTHQQLLTALKSKDPTMARDVMKDHFDRIGKEIFGDE